MSAMIWICVRRYNRANKSDEQQDEVTCTVESLEIPPEDQISDVKILRSYILSWLGEEDATNLVLKLRNPHEALIPLSMLIHSTSSETQPLFLDVVRTGECSTKLPQLYPDYKTSIEHVVETLHKRVARLEDMVPEWPARREIVMNRQLQEISSFLNFVTPRLNETSAPKINSDASTSDKNFTI